jgi:hypothetical protein
MSNAGHPINLHDGFSTPQQGSRFLYVEIESITEEQYKKWRHDEARRELARSVV